MVYRPSALSLARLQGRFNPHHDEHGKFASSSSSGVRQSLRDSSTTEDVATVLESDLSATLGHPVSVYLTGMEVGLAREHAEGLLVAAERFPNSRLATVSTHGPGGFTTEHPGDPRGESWAVTRLGAYSRNNDEISFRVGEEPSRYRAHLSVSEKAGYIAVGTPSGVAIHEYGHVVTGHDTAAYHASVAAAGRAGKVSRYGASDDRELAAEAFADVVVNGSAAPKVSRDIFTAIERDYALNGSRR
jgi:hypothetical protein